MSGMIGWFLTGGLVGGGASGVIGYTVGQSRGWSQGRTQTREAYRDGVTHGKASAAEEMDMIRRNRYHSDNHGKADHICTDFYCGGGI
jgi:hypothetical protein